MSLLTADNISAADINSAAVPKFLLEPKSLDLIAVEHLWEVINHYFLHFHQI